MNKCLFLPFATLLSIAIPTLLPAQQWTQKANFGGGNRYAGVAFSIGDKGYMGTGMAAGTALTNDFWEYDPATNAWTQKATFAGPSRFHAMAFTIGSKGYIGLGSAGYPSYNFVRDLWEYDPVANSWVQKATFPGSGRYTTASFSIGTKGYVGTGWSGPLYRDFWEYDQATNTWTQKANFGGTSRQSAVGFALNGKGYIGTGYDGSNRNDFWEYDPSTNTWLQKANFPGTPRYSASAFVLQGLGYLGCGVSTSGPVMFNDFWSYNAQANAWTQVANYPGSCKYAMSYFSNSCSGFVGTGGMVAGGAGSSSGSEYYEYSSGVSSLAGVTLTSNRIYDNVCDGGSTRLTLNGITANTLAGSDQWKWYTGSCGGTPIAGNVTSILVSPGVTTTYYVRAEGGCHTTACLSIQVVVSTSPPLSNTVFFYYPVLAYNGTSDSVVVYPVPGATWYRWNTGGNTNILFNGQPPPYESTTNKVTVSFIGPSTQGNGIGNYHISCFAGNACGRTNQANVQIRSSVPAPVNLYGPEIACPDQNLIYSVDSISGAKTYSWWFSSGSGTITGNGTRVVSVTFTSLPAVLCVHGVTSFNMNGPDLCKNITSLVAMPGSIQGNTTPCPGSTLTYAISPVPGAVSYSWTSSIPGAIISGNDTAVAITFPPGDFSGQICVAANSGCALGESTCLDIVKNAQAPVGTITGPEMGLCDATDVPFEVPATGDTIYNWTVPTGAVITSGQGTNSILVNFPANFSSGSVTVLATNNCGSASGFLVVTGPPAAPVITGSSSVCAGDVENYVASSAGATSYVWFVDSLQGNLIPTLNLNEIQVEWLTNGGLVNVIAINTCDSSSMTTFPVSSSCRMMQRGLKLQPLVYPNPSKKEFGLSFTGNESEIMILDITGRICDRIKNEVPFVTVGLEWAPGVYVLQWTEKGETKTLKLVKTP